MAKASIVLITSGQPSLNPRLVKEADALSEAGYSVTVIYQHWAAWADGFDTELLSGKRWRYIKVGGGPSHQKGLYLATRIMHKAANKLAGVLGFGGGLAEVAIGRCTSLLFAGAAKIPAQLYIAHNLAALPAAVKAAKKKNALCGFDAEDFHRNEVSDDPKDFDVRVKTYIENKYLKQIDYFTAASPLTAQRYQQLFPQITASVIRNVFPKSDIPPFNELVEKHPLKLFWFSQTVGANRGIEDVIEAMVIVKQHLQLHLMGNCSAQYRNQLIIHAKKRGLDESLIYFHDPVSPNKLLAAAGRFDIGIASETGIPLNRDLCLTNKIFTYVQCGLVLLASDTHAQCLFIKQNPGVGNVYERADPATLARHLEKYINNSTLLQTVKKSNYLRGQEDLNWETEQNILLQLVERTLNKS